MPRQQSRPDRPRRGRLAASLADAEEADEPPAGDQGRAARDGAVAAPGAGATAVDAVHVRSYDHDARHAVVVTVETLDGDEVLSERHALAPGQSARTTGRLEPGRYVVRVRVDGVERRRRRCRLGPDPSDTAVVEVGNGAVSVTTGARRSLATE